MGKQAHDVSPETLKLPLPRRLELSVARQYVETLLGNQLIVVDELIKRGDTTTEIAKVLFEETSHGTNPDLPQYNREQTEQMVQVRRFQIEKARIFTFRTSLCQRLDDMDIGAKVPMSFIFPPFPIFFLEFGPADERGSLGYQVLAGGAGHDLEGTYISYYDDVDPGIMSERGRETLGLQKGKPVRRLELCFTASPVKAPESRRTIINDTAMFASLYWTDDDLAIEEILKRHFVLFTDNPEMSDAHCENLMTNIHRVTKCLLYLRSDSRHQEAVNEAKDLEDRLSDMKNPTKKRKAERRLDRAYDRIVIGPNKAYRPMSEVLDSIEHRSGVRPHVRRAHWSSRWAGKGRAELRPVKIDAVLVNAGALSDDDANLLRKDYDVR